MTVSSPSASAAASGKDPDALSRSAYDHLWMHFARVSSCEHASVPTIVRGEGTYVYDARGKRYVDGLAGLFVVQAGHGRVELAETAFQQTRELRISRSPATGSATYRT